MAGTELVRGWAGFQAQIKVTPSDNIGEVSRSQITKSLINCSEEVKLGPVSSVTPWKIFKERGHLDFSKIILEAVWRVN